MREQDGRQVSIPNRGAETGPLLCSVEFDRESKIFGGKRILFSAKQRYIHFGGKVIFDCYLIL